MDLYMKNKIAVMILGPLGDVINTSGIFKRLRETFPDAVLSIITINTGIKASYGIKEIDERYVFNEPLDNHKLIETIKFGLSIRGNFDTVLVLDNSLRSAICAFFTGAKRRIGRGRELRELFLTDIIPYLPEERNDEIHVSEHFSRCLKPLGVYKKNMGTYFEFSDEDEKFVSKLLKENGIKENENFVGLCPACHSEKKSMSIKDTAEIIKKINENGNKVILVGGSDISEFVTQLKDYGNLDYIDFTGKTSFTQTASLIDKCSKFVSVDTSCMHLSFARKVPTVSIFFSKLYKKWGALDKDRNANYVNLQDKKVDVDLVMKKLKSLPEKYAV